MAQRASNIARHKKSARLYVYLNTLALAQLQNGDTEAAVETQREAIELMPDSAPKEEQEHYQKCLERYESALDKDTEPAEQLSGSQRIRTGFKNSTVFQVLENNDRFAVSKWGNVRFASVVGCDGWHGRIRWYVS